ncbi:MAG: FAD-dependent oxidoreductase [Clostridia bacterium]|nr:FAD-dependent oxidoreductase [Clostridia bacterium]
MKEYRQNGFETITHRVDLCVVGGGLAGLCAAIAAARRGSSVALMHERPMLGGNASSEIRMWVCGAFGENNRASGIIEEIELENYYRNPDKIYALWDTILYEKAAKEENLTLLLNCTCCACECENDEIKSVLGFQMTTQTWQRVEATYFADCSGDSALAYLCGADFSVCR